MRSSKSPFEPLPQFQRGQRSERKDQRRNPEAHDDFRLAPAHQLEMMVDRGHAKNALPREAERGDLQNHRQRLDNENAADEKEQDLLLEDDGDDAERSTERERTDVAHENFEIGRASCRG